MRRKGERSLRQEECGFARATSKLDLWQKARPDPMTVLIVSDPICSLEY